MKQRDIIALVDAITPGIDAAFSKVFAAMADRLVKAEQRVADLESIARIDIAAEIAKLLPIVPTASEIAALIPAPVVVTADEVVERAREAINASVLTAVDAAGKALPPAVPGKDGASVTAEDVAPLITSEVTKAVAALPPAAPGKDADPEVVAAMVREAVAALPPAAPGKDADPALIKQLVGEAVAALPPAAPGKDATPEQIAAAVEKALATWDRPKDGASVTVEQLAPMVAEQVNMKVAALPSAKDGVGLAGALKDHEGNLTLTLTNGEVVKLGRVDGAPGKDGLGFEDMEMVHDGERNFAFRLVRGDRTKEFTFTVPVVLDRGVFKEGTEYVAGDGTTHQGSFWIAQKDTKDRPSTSDAWRLAVKKGRDGQDLRTNEPKAQAKVKL